MIFDILGALCAIVLLCAIGIALIISVPFAIVIFISVIYGIVSILVTLGLSFVNGFRSAISSGHEKEH